MPKAVEHRRCACGPGISLPGSECQLCDVAALRLKAGVHEVWSPGHHIRPDAETSFALSALSLPCVYSGLLGGYVSHDHSQL